MANFDVISFENHIGQCVADEFDELDEVFWSVVHKLPQDSPFLRRLLHTFQGDDKIETDSEPEASSATVNQSVDDGGLELEQIEEIENLCLHR